MLRWPGLCARSWLNDPCQVVVDPVLQATAGGGLDDPDEQKEIMDLICARATVVCPNLPELAALGRGEDMAQQAEDVLARHANLEAVLVSGGHGGDKGSVQDILFVRGGSPRVRRLSVFVPSIFMALAVLWHRPWPHIWPVARAWMRPFAGPWILPLG